MGILVFDWGGSAIKYGVWNDDKLMATASTKTPDSWQSMQEVMLAIFHEKRKEIAITGIAVSAPGTVDDTSGVIGGISAIPYIHHFAIKQQLEQLFDLPVALENDANCAGIAEVAMGSAKGKNAVLFLVIGSGVGGVFMQNGVIYRGRNLAAGEFGMMLLEGTLTLSETASPVVMAKRYCLRAGLEPQSLNGEQVFSLAQTGNNIAIEEMNRFYDYLVKGITNLQVCFDPDCIVIGGGVSQMPGLLVNIRQRLDGLLHQKQWTSLKPEIQICALHNDANLVGAAIHFERQQPAFAEGK